MVYTLQQKVKGFVCVKNKHLTLNSNTLLYCDDIFVLYCTYFVDFRASNLFHLQEMRKAIQKSDIVQPSCKSRVRTT